MKKIITMLIITCLPVLVFGQDAELVKKAQAGDAWAQYSLARKLKDKDNEKYAYWLKKVAGNTTSKDQLAIVDAQHDLGEAYRYGKYGFPKDEQEYLKWTKKSANNGYSPACFSLGLHFKSTGNRQEAIYWLKKGMDIEWENCKEEDKYCAEALSELGVSYHPGNAGNSSGSYREKSSSSASEDTPLFSGTYTISGTGYSSTGTVNGIEIPGNKVEIYRNYIKVNGNKCEPAKYYGEWTWYDAGYYGFYAVGPGYKMNQITVTPFGNVQTPMYLEDGSEYTNQNGGQYNSSGNTGSGNVRNNSSSTFDYQSQYRRYERLAESAYNSLTTLGTRYSNNGQTSGTTGNRSNVGGNIVTLKRNLRDAQRNMQRIRNEAAQHGITIAQSSWETATVQ